MRDERAGAAARAKDHPRAVAMKLVVDQHLGGCRADLFLCQRIKRLSRTRAQAIIQKGDLERAGGAVLRPSSRVVALETLTLWRVPPDEDPDELSIPIVHEDDELVVFDKPPGITIHPSARYYATTLTQLLRRRGYPISTAPDAVRVPRPAHRLDRETSGVLVCCRTEKSERLWKDRFLKSRVEKTYLALCEGEAPFERVTLDAPLGFLKGLPVRIKVGRCDDGLPALTEVSVIWRGNGRSLCVCRPKTGRTHQIRAHLSEAGLPLVGDKLYGEGQEAWFAKYADEGLTEELEEQLSHHRHALHAAVLKAEDALFGARWPDDLRAVEPGAGEAADAFLDGMGVPLTPVRVWVASQSARDDGEELAPVGEEP